MKLSIEEIDELFSLIMKVVLSSWFCPMINLDLVLATEPKERV